jgi:hypothetical protein
MFSAAAEAQTYCRCVVKLCFFPSCFKYQDLFVGDRIVCPSESYFSRKVMSEVSESRLEGVNRAKLKFSKIITTTSQVSVRNIIESVREGEKQIAIK